MKKAETKDRIKEALEIREMKQSELVEKTGIDKGQMSSYISGKYKPKQNNLHLIAKALSVDEAWLMGYDVPMTRLHGKISIELPDDANIYNYLINRLEKYDELSEKEQEVLGNLYLSIEKIIPSKDHLSRLKSYYYFLNEINKAKVLTYAENLFNIQKMEGEQFQIAPLIKNDTNKEEKLSDSRKAEEEHSCTEMERFTDSFEALQYLKSRPNLAAFKNDADKLTGNDIINLANHIYNQEND